MLNLKKKQERKLFDSIIITFNLIKKTKIYYYDHILLCDTVHRKST